MDKNSKSLIRANVINLANKILEIHVLLYDEKVKEARAILYDIKRFDIGNVYQQLVDWEYKQGREQCGGS
jgi:hypothetical protein